MNTRLAITRENRRKNVVGRSIGLSGFLRSFLFQFFTVLKSHLATCRKFSVPSALLREQDQ